MRGRRLKKAAFAGSEADMRDALAGTMFTREARDGPPHSSAGARELSSEESRSVVFATPISAEQRRIRQNAVKRRETPSMPVPGFAAPPRVRNLLPSSRAIRRFRAEGPAHELRADSGDRACSAIGSRHQQPVPLRRDSRETDALVPRPRRGRRVCDSVSHRRWKASAVNEIGKRSSRAAKWLAMQFCRSVGAERTADVLYVRRLEGYLSTPKV